MRFQRWIALAGLALVAACQVPSGSEALSGQAYLVRHAEKVLDVADPGLTEDGHKRAQDLADELGAAGLTAIWSTNYRRTLATGALIAEQTGLEVQLYDPRDLDGFAAILKADRGQTVLVIGHSNTTPYLAEALGGDAGSPIEEASEYDRLYVVDLATGASELRRYGAAYSPVEPDVAPAKRNDEGQ